LASIPSLKSRNYGLLAAPAGFNGAEFASGGRPVEVIVVFGGANIDCCGQLGGGEIVF